MVGGCAGVWAKKDQEVHAKDFFDPKVPQGQLNPDRGLIQYRNGGKVPPQPDDLLVFTDTVYGHVAIVTAVDADSIEVIQQNKESSRQKFILVEKDGGYFVGDDRQPAGWLRKE